MYASHWVFMCFVKVVIHHLHEQGTHCLTYMDDIILGMTRMEVTMNTNITTSFLSKLGWKINIKKSLLTLTQQLEFLGFIMDTHGEPTF